MKIPLKTFSGWCLAILAAAISISLCRTPFEEGSWTNIDPNTRGITRVDVRFICQDQILNGQPCCPTGPAYYVRLLGSCYPSDCDWGEVGARRLSSGHIYAYYDHGFARRYVYLMPSAYLPNTLWMYMYTDFVDPARRDYSLQQWFTE